MMQIPFRLTLPAVLLGAFAAVYVGGRLLGVISLVAYENEHRVQWGIAHQTSSSPRFATPVVLRPGEALAADYRVKAPFGSMSLWVRGPGGVLASRAYANVSGEREARVLFVASESGLHGYDADASAVAGEMSCEDAAPSNAILPRGECPTLDVDYAVTWRRLAAEEVARSDAPRVIVPTAEGESVHQTL